MTEKKSWTYILMRLPEQQLELVFLKKQAKLYFNFLFKKAVLKFKNYLRASPRYNT